MRPSFIPDRTQRELRDLTRTRTTLIDERSAAVNRLQEVLEDANLKVASVATDVMGVSGRAMLRAILAGETDPAALAALAKGKLRKKRVELERALGGRVSAHHRCLLATHLAHIDFLSAQIDGLDETIARFDEEIARRCAADDREALIELLDTIPGIGRAMAELLIAELGVDMTRFPTPGHLAAWAGVAPGNNERGGRPRAARTRQGNAWLKTALV